MVITMVRTLLRKGEDVRMSFATDSNELSISKVKSMDVVVRRKGTAATFDMEEANGIPSKTTLPFSMADKDWNIKKKDGYFLLHHPEHGV